MPGPLTLAEIVARLGGRVLGDAATVVSQVGSLQGANGEQITFLANTRHRSALSSTRAGAIVLYAEAQDLTDIPRIVAGEPYLYFARVSQLLNPVLPPQPGIDRAACIAAGARVAADARVEAGAVIDEGAEVGARAWVGAGCYLGANSVLGEDARLHPGAVIYAGCRIGARAVIHSGAVIGADGFGLANDAGRWLKIPQIGGVVIGDDVEVGANTTIDRGTVDDTVIEDGVKLDNQIQVGHNVRIGAHTAIAGCAGIAGSTQIGKHCAIGGAAMIVGHIQIVDHVTISGGTLISRSIRKPGTYTGIFPFADNAVWTRNAAHLRQLAKLAERVAALENAIERKARK